MTISPRPRAGAARAAFTVLELLAALAILAVVTGGTLLAWRRVEAALRLEAGLHQLAADLQGARTLAVASAGRVRLVFARGSGRYERQRADDAGRYRADRRRELPRGIVVADVNSGGDLTFSARGHAENATVVLEDPRGRRRSLVLNQRGRVTILRGTT
jgi:prepilin-type N-terminal cleavage/methylation domain-containing protein